MISLLPFMNDFYMHFWYFCRQKRFYKQISGFLRLTKGSRQRFVEINLKINKKIVNWIVEFNACLLISNFWNFNFECSNFVQKISRKFLYKVEIKSTLTNMWRWSKIRRFPNHFLDSCKQLKILINVNFCNQ